MSVHFKNRGIALEAEVRNGPLIVCEARLLRTGENWVVDNIETAPEFRRQGYAKELIQAAFDASGGFPVHAFSIKPEAQPFWDSMKRLNLCT